MTHFFAPDGNKDNFEDIGLFAPDSVSRARVKVGTSFDVALWGGKDLTVSIYPPSSHTGITLAELTGIGEKIRKFRCWGILQGTFWIRAVTGFFFEKEQAKLEVVVGDGSMMKTSLLRFLTLRAAWIAYRANISPVTNQFDQLRQDLYQVRNAGYKGNPPISAWPAYLIDTDDGMMAAIEHYFLCRAWVGNGIYPASEMQALNFVYDFGKAVGISPRHNPNKPTTPLTELQLYAQSNGIEDGAADLAASGKSAPGWKTPPRYY